MGGKSIQIHENAADTVVKVDSFTAGFSTIDVAHRKIHEGNAYVHHQANSSVADGAFLEFVVRTGSDELLHSTFAAQAGGDTFFELFDLTTGSLHAVAGSVSPMNRKFTIADNAVTAIFTTPSVEAVGERKIISLIAGGTGGNAGGGSGEQRDEHILKPDTDYLLRATNIAGAGKAISLQIDFYIP